MFEDVRKYIEATVEQLSPARAQQLAKQLLEPDARKEQVQKAAQELVDWSQRNRDRLKEFVTREVKAQLAAIGVATQADVDALTKRVRNLERSGGATAAARSAKTSAKKPAAKKPAAKRATAGR